MYRVCSLTQGRIVNVMIELWAVLVRIWKFVEEICSLALTWCLANMQLDLCNAILVICLYITHDLCERYFKIRMPYQYQVGFVKLSKTLIKFSCHS